MHTRRGLWSHANFRRLWLARTISGLGSEISYLALPLLAAGTLGATPTQMSILTAAGTAPLLVFGLVAGVWVDRLRRRPLMIVADVLRALLLGSIPLMAAFGVVRLEQLYVVAFASGTLGLLFGLADNALLPALVRRDELVEGNAKLAMSVALTEGAGPGIASILIQALTAPLAIVVDVCSFVTSGFLLWRIKAQETPERQETGTNIWRELRAGLGFLWRQPILRATTAIGAVLQLTGGVSDALLVLFITRTLELPPTVIGAFFGVGAFTAFMSSLTAERITRRLGIGPTVGVGALLISAGWLVMYSAMRPAPVAIAIILGSGLVSSFGNTLFNIAVASLQQAITPEHILGRTGAANVFITGGVLPLGALIGGALAAVFGIRPTLLIAGIIRVPFIIAIVWGWLWHIKVPPQAN